MQKWFAIALIVLPSFAHAAELPAWLAGHWTGTSNGVAMEEHWTSPAGHLLLGMHRDIGPKKTLY